MIATAAFAIVGVALFVIALALAGDAIESEMVGPRGDSRRYWVLSFLVFVGAVAALAVAAHLGGAW